MALVRPRLNDFHGLPFTQEEVDFAIPFLDEDIPLYLDPFLLWKSPSMQDNALHASLTNSFNYLGHLYIQDENKAVTILKDISECDSAGLGNSKTKHGKKIGDKLAHEILGTFKTIPQIQKNGFIHFETAQLLVDQFSKDRISDIACNLIKSFLIDFTIQSCKKQKIPMGITEIEVFDTKKHSLVLEKTTLPLHPITQEPVLLVPKRWLRQMPWLNFDDYFKAYTVTAEHLIAGKNIPRIEILEYNRKNYDAVQAYIERKQLEQADCKNDPLFTQIPVLSAKRKKDSILKLPTGKTESADKDFEDSLCPLLASVLYPELDFAQSQCRTVTNVLIRDLIFYNNKSHEFLRDIYEEYGSRQLVFELKNVKEVNTDHVDQLNRYLGNDFGRFGVIFTRNAPPKKVLKNTVDLWSGQRKCILIMDDSDLELMCQVYESKQRNPLDVIKKKYVEFRRQCPC